MQISTIDWSNELQFYRIKIDFRTTSTAIRYSQSFAWRNNIWNIFYRDRKYDKRLINVAEIFNSRIESFKKKKWNTDSLSLIFFYFHCLGRKGKGSFSIGELDIVTHACDNWVGVKKEMGIRKNWGIWCIVTSAGDCLVSTGRRLFFDIYVNEFEI